MILPILLATSAMAAEPQLLTDGQPAPHEGYLYSVEDHIETMTDSINAYYYEKITEKYEIRVQLSDEKIQNLEGQVEAYAHENEELKKEDTWSTWEKVLWFLIGGLAGRGL